MMETAAKQKTPTATQKAEASPRPGLTWQRPEKDNDAEALSCLLTMVQPKLKVGSPDDPLEREADRAADMVMTMPEPQTGPKPT
ncbi:MAG TPA: hypothetical protein VN260_02835 [Dissulfurispiraceae bacterium]|nr:hypothetical protein [Dissulfurispiraceae bacterium]